MEKNLFYGISNFKLIKDAMLFAFEDLTILTGKNSSGKSSLIRSVQLMHEFLEQSNEISFKNDIQVSKAIPFLGDFSNLISYSSKNKFIAYKLPLILDGVDEFMMINVEYALNKNKLNTGRLNKISLALYPTEEEIFSLKFITKNSYDIKINLQYLFQKYKEQCSLLRKLESEEEQSDTSSLFIKFKLLLSNIDSLRHLLYEEDEELLSSIPAHEPKNGSKKNIISKGKLEFYRNEFLTKFTVRVYHYPEGRSLTKQEKSEIIKNIDDPIRLGFLYSFNSSFDLGSLVKLTTEGRLSSILAPNSFTINPLIFLLNEEKYIITNDISEDEWTLKKSNIHEKIDNFKIKGYCEFRNKNNPYYVGYSSFFDLGDDHLKDNYFNKLKKLDVGDIDDYLEYGMINRFDFFIKYFVEENIINSFNFWFIKFFNNSDFISSSRNEVKRSYDNDSFGRILFEILEKNINYGPFINKYIKIFEIGDELYIERDKESEFIRIYIKKGSNRTLLSDLGFGISQVLPILMKILVVASKGNRNHKIFIEEPESNLHPALQSKLADMFVEASKQFGILFIIETHSEYLIRKLQYLTAKGELSSEDSVIYYFNSPEANLENEQQIKAIVISEDGTLSSDFGSGFFDEADKIALDLFLLNQNQKN